MDSEKSAESTALSKSKKLFYMSNKKCFIEVIQCSGEDMNLVLMSGLTPPTQPPQLMLPPPPTVLPASAPVHHLQPQQLAPPVATAGPLATQTQLMTSPSTQHHLISPGLLHS